MQTDTRQPKKQATFKRLLKVAVSVGFYAYTLSTNTLGRLFGRKPQPFCVVLDYHAVTDQDRFRFAQQMDALLRWASPIPAGHRDALKPDGHYVAVTFDDGFLCVIQNALPELVKRRIPATFFVVADALGLTPKWATFGEDYNTNEPIASASQLLDLPRDLITIGSHTLSHPLLPTLTAAQARTELDSSRRKLESLFGRNVTLFSFPYGATNGKLVQLCREVGYERIFTILPTPTSMSDQDYVVGRVVVDPTDWPLEFRLKVWGAYQWLPRAFRLKKKLFSTPMEGYQPAPAGHEKTAL